jgi:hypothetical protein
MARLDEARFAAIGDDHGDGVGPRHAPQLEHRAPLPTRLGGAEHDEGAPDSAFEDAKRLQPLKPTDLRGREGFLLAHGGHDRRQHGRVVHGEQGQVGLLERSTGTLPHTATSSPSRS